MMSMMTIMMMMMMMMCSHQLSSLEAGHCLSEARRVSQLVQQQTNIEQLHQTTVDVRQLSASVNIILIITTFSILHHSHYYNILILLVSSSPLKSFVSMLGMGRTIPPMECFYSEECCDSSKFWSNLFLLAGCPSWCQTKHINICNVFFIGGQCKL